MTISRVSRSFIVFVSLLAAVPIAQAFTRPSPLSFGWMLLGIGIVYRLTRLRLAVNDEFVVVQNFFEQITIPIWEAEAELAQAEASIMLADSEGGMANGGRTLFIKRMWHDDKVAVGVAPRYGDELERIHSELSAEILRRRGAPRRPVPIAA